MPEDWVARRTDAAAEYERTRRLREAKESEQARALLAEFVAEANRRGLPAVPLRARSYDGRHRYRTPLRGWYLRRNETVAVDTDGEFYLLAVPPSWAALVRGAQPAPSDPPLVLGKGGRDGETMDLTEAIARALG